ncbi:hypothetical protein HOF56_01535 [Candidatus Peribacteria bacterium]|nr:hypothetical protein [Candidatus Peribacteria bacterium]MBT4020773.1 hypothetical protein [Candidatus Peribacteria bacterium]MBT4241053.1 hypothetical protein [Candidatus Peribacteria bacterium]MBT4474448.1 hypothetical protein [Candidatus Peribacteria bacterium]
MILRSAILGISIAAALVIVMIAIPQRTTEPELSDFQSELTESDLPPRLFPMFAHEEEGEVALRISKTPENRDTAPGSRFTWQVELENLGSKDLKNLKVEERYDASRISILDAHEGEIEENKISWEIDEIDSGNVWFARIEAEVPNDAENNSFSVTSYVSGDMIKEIPSSSRMATSSVTVVDLPETGADMSTLLAFLVALAIVSPAGIKTFRNLS